MTAFFDVSTIINAFRDAISKAGMSPPADIEPGKINRFSEDGGRNLNGWCSLFVNADGSAGGAFGNWKNVNEKWFYAPDGQALSFAQKQDFFEQIRQAQEKAARERQESHAKAAAKAKALWDKAGPANPEHGYLVKKQVQAHSIRQHGKALLIPVMDETGNTISLQEILPDVSKKFLPDGKVEGGYLVLGVPAQSDIISNAAGYPEKMS